VFIPASLSTGIPGLAGEELVEGMLYLRLGSGYTTIFSFQENMKSKAISEDGAMSAG
jgi:hypothetical protein